MQNIDFYSGKETRVMNNSAMLHDADNVARLDAMYRKEAYKNNKRASRMLSLIIALCIISFTTGLVMGLKFANGSNAAIIDSQTASALSTMRSRVSSMMKQEEQVTKNAPKAVFPKEEYPFVIRINRNFNEKESKEIAQFLSKNGHTVIISQKNQHYKLYVGPYKAQADVDAAVKVLRDYRKKNWFDKMEAVKR
jgi:preprotein translocase subunit SecF